MENQQIFLYMINDNIREINDIIDCLYTTSHPFDRNKLLNRLRRRVSSIHMVFQCMQNTPAANNTRNDTVRVFSPAELSKYTGKDGNPAYVAVNGIVYDVTDVAAWAGGIHFGLIPGRDMTSEFASCHRGEQILSKLKPVGKMV